MSHTVTASSMSSSSSNSSDSSSSIASIDESNDFSTTPIDRHINPPTDLSSTIKNPFLYEVNIKKEGTAHGIVFKNTPVGVTIASTSKNSPGEHLPKHRLVEAVNGAAPGSSEEAHQMVTEILGAGFTTFTVTVNNQVCEDYESTFELSLLRGDEPLGFTVENTSSQTTGGLLITTIERHSIMAGAGVPVGSVLLSIDGKPLTNLQDFTSAITSLRSRDITQYKVQVLVKQGSTLFTGRSKERTISEVPNIQPARNQEESALRERLRRDVMLKEQRMSRRERRIDFCNGFALTHLEFITNYGNEIGSQRWHSAADVTTSVLSVKELVPTSSLTVSMIGQRVQIQETAQVIVVVSQGPAFKWYKIPIKELTAKELAYMELLDNRPPEEPTLLQTVSQLKPSSRLTSKDVGTRVQLRTTGQVVRVAPRSKTYAWQYVPEIEWTMSEIRFATTLPSTSKAVVESETSHLSDLWVDGSPIFSPTLHRQGVR
eukprot:TRINITY_DN11192_c0_g1_i1.p1 TRINITY_DN11192_c0_g1~~TRINITY_DN11192_c0_g1_i1.p1  ORF type:complete len:487 (+),score=95.37 TRINITY_DN11192_c0_g1_i1:175-1635(+)